MRDPGLARRLRPAAPAGLLLLALGAGGLAWGEGDEPARRVERRRWPLPTTVMAKTEVLDPGLRTAIAPLRIGGIQWGGAIYPGDVGSKKAKRLSDFIRRAHALGAKYIGSINGPGFHLRSLVGEEMLGLDGKPQTHGKSKAKVFKCLLRPKVFSAFVETAKRCVDLGMDGFILDSWSMGGQLCFCDRCLEFYREVLREHGEEPALKELRAEVDPESFDYGRYLRDKGVDPSLPDRKLPLGLVFRKYRFDQVLFEKRRFWKLVRAYAGEKGREDFVFTANVYAMPAATFAVHDLLDYFLVETAYFGVYGGTPPRCSSIALHKKARMAGKRAVLQLANIDTVRRLIGRPSIETLLKIWIAEAHASGNLFSFARRTHGGTLLDVDERTKTLDLPAAALKPYFVFLQAHPEIYLETTSPARVGVLYFMTRGVDREYRAVCKLLHDAHLQFDAVLIGDGRWNDAVPEGKELSRYQALILPLTRAPLPAAAIEALARYVAGGGRLLLSSAIVPSRLPSGEPSFDALSKLAAPRKGDPAVWRLLPYLKRRDPALRARFSAALRVEPFVSTDAPADVGVLCGRAGQRTLVHLVNYGYVEGDDEVSDAKSIRVTVATAARRARLYSPDRDGVVPLKLERSEKGVAFTVPELHIYSVVVLD